MARTRSKSKVNIPIIKLEEKEHPEVILDTCNESRPLKKSKIISSNSTIHQLTRAKFEELKPSYKGSKVNSELRSQKYGHHNIPDKIENVNKSITPNLINNINQLSEHLERLNKFKLVKNFDIDIRTIKILNSNIEEYNEHDLKLIKTFQDSSPNDMTKLYQLYDIEPPLDLDSLPAAQANTSEAAEAAATTTQLNNDKIPFL